MEANWWWIVGTILASFLGGTGGAQMIKAVFGRKPRREVETASEVTLSKTAMDYAKQLEEDAAQARKTAADAWAQAALAQKTLVSVNTKLDEVQLRVQVLLRYTTWIVSRIHEEDMTMDRLRSLVQTQPVPFSE